MPFSFVFMSHEDGEFKPKHVGECKLYSSTTYILFVKKVQLIGIIFNKRTYTLYTQSMCDI